MVYPRAINQFHEAPISSFLHTNKCRRSLRHQGYVLRSLLSQCRQLWQTPVSLEAVGITQSLLRSDFPVFPDHPSHIGTCMGYSRSLSSGSSLRTNTADMNRSPGSASIQLREALKDPAANQDVVCQTFDADRYNADSETLVLLADAFGRYGERGLEEGVDPAEMGRRLGVVLKALGSQGWMEKEPHRFLCWSVQEQVFRGDLRGIDRLGRSVDYKVGSHRHYYSRVRMTTGRLTIATLHRFLLLWRFRQGDISIAFDLVLRHWALLRPYLRHKSIDADPSMARHGKAILHILMDACISAPVAGNSLLNSTHYSPRNSSRLASLYLFSIAKAGLSRESEEYFRAMRLNKMKVDPPSWAATLNALVDNGQVIVAHQLLHDFLPSKGIQAISSPFIHDAALKIYAKQGDIALAQEAFDLISRTNQIRPHHVTQLLQARAATGDADGAVSVFERFFVPTNAGDSVMRPDVTHFTAIMNAYLKKGDGDGFRRWHARASETGLAFDTGLYNVILDFHVTNSDIISVHNTLDQMQASGSIRDVVTYTILIRLFARRKDLKSGEALAKQALREGIEPDPLFVASLLDLHLECSSWAGVIHIVDYLQSHHYSYLLRSTHVLNQLLKAYVQTGVPFRTVHAMFKKSKDLGISTDETSYCHLIQSACNGGQLTTAMELLNELECSTTSTSNELISARPLTIIMGGYLRLDQRSKAKAIFEEIVRRGLRPLAPACVHIMKAYGSINTRESLQVAEGFLNRVVEMIKDDPIKSDHYEQCIIEMIVPMLKAHAQRGSPEMVEHYRRILQTLGLDSHIRVLTQLLDAHRLSGDIGRVQQVWTQILGILDEGESARVIQSITQTDAVPKLSHSWLLNSALSIYIDALSAAGRYDEIIDTWALLEKKGFVFDHHNWNYLSVAMVRAGLPERAFHVIENVILPRQQVQDQKPHCRNPHPHSLFISDPEDSSRPEPSALRATQSPFQERSNIMNEPVLPIELVQANFNKVWKVHSATLNALHNVILRLSRGYLISAVVPGQEFQDAPHDPIGASAILRHIEEKFPGTMQAIRQVSKQGPKSSKPKHRRQRIWRGHVAETEVSKDPEPTPIEANGNKVL
ncbi:hypothetical protein FRC02_012016 [Tulasnella sp. 418]|nr:hypothetical protein FRC02_012016 [Tulasnella sp. 418]